MADAMDAEKKKGGAAMGGPDHRSATMIGQGRHGINPQNLSAAFITPSIPTLMVDGAEAHMVIDNVMWLVVDEAFRLVDIANMAKRDAMAPRLFPDPADARGGGNPLEGLTGPYARCLAAVPEYANGHEAWSLTVRAPAEIAETKAARRIEDAFRRDDEGHGVFALYEALGAMETLRRLHALAERGKITPYWEYPYEPVEGWDTEHFDGMLTPIIIIRAGGSPVTASMAREVVNLERAGVWETITEAIDRIGNDYNAACVWAHGEGGNADAAQALERVDGIDVEGTALEYVALRNAALIDHAGGMEAAIKARRDKPATLSAPKRIGAATQHNGPLIGQDRLAQMFLDIRDGKLETESSWMAEGKYPTKVRLLADPMASKLLNSMKEQAYRLEGGLLNLFDTTQSTIIGAQERAGGEKYLRIRTSSFENVGSATTGSVDPRNRDQLRHSTQHDRARLHDQDAFMAALLHIRVVVDYWERDAATDTYLQKHVDVGILEGVHSSGGEDEWGRPLNSSWTISDGISLLGIPALARPVQLPLLDTGSIPKRLSPLERSVRRFIDGEIRALEYDYETTGKVKRPIDRERLANLGNGNSYETAAKRRRFLERIRRACVGEGNLFEAIERTYRNAPDMSTVRIEPIMKAGNHRDGKPVKDLLVGVNVSIEEPRPGLKTPSERDGKPKRGRRSGR